MDTISNTTMPNQKVSLSKKQSKTWTKQMADYVVGLAISCNDKSKVRDFLNAANGNIPESTYEYVFKTFGIDGTNTTDEEKLEQTLIKDLRKIDLLAPIKDRYLGEFATSYDNFQIYTDDPETTINRNKEFGKKIMAVMQQELINVLNQQNIQTGQQSQPTPDIPSMLKEFIKSWDSERIDRAQKRLNLLNNEINAKIKYSQLYYYYWACEECYTYRYIQNDRVFFEVVSPLEYYRIPTDNLFVEDDDMGMRLSNRSVDYIKNRYSEYLSSSDIAYLDNINDANFRSSEQFVSLLKSRCIEYGMSERDFINNQGYTNSIISGNSVFRYNDSVPVVNYFFTTDVKVGYLSFYNSIGEIEQRLVEEDYKLDISNGDIEITWDWIKQKFEGEIIGFNSGSKNLEAIYTKPRPIQVQRELFTDLNITKAPYNGISYIHPDSSANPIPYRMLPYTVLYRIYAYQIERAIQKWKSMVFIPESVLTDSEDFNLDERLGRMNAENLFIFNDARVSQQALNSIKEVATTATYNYVSTINQLMIGLKQEAWEVVNMTPTRMGNQKAYQGKSVTDSSLEQSEISSSWGLDMFNIFRGVDYLANFDYSKVAWSDGKQGSYIDESTHESHFVEIDPFEHLSTNIGIHVGNSKLYNEKLGAIKQLGMAFAQSGDNDTAIESILNDNLQVLKKVVSDATKAKRAYEQQMEEAKNQAMIQAEQIKKETKAEENQTKLQEIEMSNQALIKGKLIDQQTKLLEIEMKLQVDTNGNGYIDELERFGDILEKNQAKIDDIQLRREAHQLNVDKFEWDKKHPKNNKK